MSPQLIEAVRERIMLGYTKEQVYSELKQAGYDDLTIEQAYQRAGAPQAAQPISASTMPPQEEQAATPGGAVTQSVRQLSSFGQMFSGSFRYVWGRKDLLLLIMIPTILSVLLSEVVPGIELLLALVNMVMYSMALYVLAMLDVRSVSVGEAWQWIYRNFSKYLWVAVLSAVVVMGGMMLLVVPGIIVSIMIAFSVFVLMREGVRGMAALRRSRSLVQGYWWAVFGRSVLFSIVTFFIVFGVAFTVGLLSVGVPNGEMLFVALLQIVSAVFQLAGMRFSAYIFHGLRVIKAGQTEQNDATRWQYTVLAWLGLLFPVSLVIGAIVLASLDDARLAGQTAELRQELNLVRLSAERYYQGADSYLGVCTELELAITGATSGVANCYDSETAWAMTLSERIGDMRTPLCVDHDSAPDFGTIKPGATECTFTSDREVLDRMEDAAAKERAVDLRERSGVDG
jgi:hypothetical protein